MFIVVEDARQVYASRVPLALSGPAGSVQKAENLIHFRRIWVAPMRPMSSDLLLVSNHPWRILGTFHQL